MNRNRIGIKKEVDKLGRMVIPSEMRHRYGIEHEVELVMTEEGVLLRSPQYCLVRREDKEP